MVTLLSEIAERTQQDNQYLGDAGIGRMREQAARMEGAPAQARFKLLLDLGREELRVGNTEDAIERLLAANALLPELPENGRQSAATYATILLGVSYLRWGETQNCVARHTSESCIVPIRGSGVHVNQEGSRKAIEQFNRTIEIAGDSWERIPAIWLLNLAAMTVGEYPDGVPAALRVPPEIFAEVSGFPRFTDTAPALGINGFDLSGGAVVDDFTGDGLLDVFTSTWDTNGPCRFMVNRGDGRFDDRTAAAGLTGILGGLNLVQADYDNDGDIDLLILRGAWLDAAGRHPNSLLRNNGDSTFSDVTFDAGLGDAHYPTQTASWADYDNDGDLDLYIGNEAKPGQNFPCQLFRNNGDGTFTDLARDAGVENLRYAKGVIWGDYDNDRFPDLYVSNARFPNRLYHNNGDGTFTDVAMQLNVAAPIDSFPVWFWDFDNDGALDLFVSSYFMKPSLTRLFAVASSYLGLEHQAETRRVYKGDGKGGFTDVATQLGLTRLTLPMGSNFGDLDNDGFLDFYLGTGYPSYLGLIPNVMFRNHGGTRFVDVTTAGGFGNVQKGHGVVFADLDQDGDQDVLEQMGGAFPGDGFGNVFYENPGFGNSWIVIRLAGGQSNRFGVGARIRAEITENGKPRTIYKHVNSGGSFGCNPLTQQVGLGQADRIDKLEIYWPTSDQTQRFDDVAVNQAIEIAEGSNEFQRFAWGAN